MPRTTLPKVTAAPAEAGPTAEGAAAAYEAGLRYVPDDAPGIARRRVGKGFSYRLPRGGPLRDPATLRRIRALAIPPAWTQVWICPDPQGHIQATGRDAKGRKQYRYHPRWREVRDSAKYAHMLDFARALPGIRARIDADMRRPGLLREKVLATVVHLLDSTLIRVGNDEYAKQNRSFGLTTLQDRHVAVRGTELRFSFTGKSGRTWRVGVADRRVARIIRALQELPGQELFRYFDEAGEMHSVTSSDVNEYLRAIAGRDVTAKDFRTWAGTVLAALALHGLEPAGSPTAAKRNLRAAIAGVAERLGNTPTICRACYVHPDLIECYLEGELALRIEGPAPGEDLPDLRPEEAAVLALLAGRPGRAKRAPGSHRHRSPPAQPAGAGLQRIALKSGRSPL